MSAASCRKEGASGEKREPEGCRFETAEKEDDPERPPEETGAINAYRNCKRNLRISESE